MNSNDERSGWHLSHIIDYGIRSKLRPYTLAEQRVRFTRGVDMIRSTLLMTIGYSAFAAITVSGAPKRFTDRIADQANEVIVGEVLSGQQSGSVALFVLSAGRVIKGEVASGDTLNVRADLGFATTQSLKGNYGIWFLKKVQTGQWTLIPCRQGRIQFTDAYFPLSKAVSPVGASANAKPVTANQGIAAELTAVLEAGQYRDRYQLGDLASGIWDLEDSEVILSFYRRISTRSDLELRFIGISGLVRAGDPAALTELVRNVDKIPGLANKNFPFRAIISLRDATSEQIDAMAAISSSNIPLLVRSAAFVLQETHTRYGVPILAKLLDSPDSEVRKSAMRGLSLFVDNLPMITPENIPNMRWLVPQGPAPYKTTETDRFSLSRRVLRDDEEAAYLQFWKLWWARMRNELSQSTSH